MEIAEATEPFFRREGALIIPQPHAVGPWEGAMMNGRNTVAILAWAIERDHGEDGLVCARLTVDLLRPIPLAPISISTRRTRDGKRLRAVIAEAVVDGKLVATASALLLRQGEHPEVDPWRPPEWDMPHPETLERLVSPEAENVQLDTRPEFAGRFFAEGQRRLWFRETISLVDDEPWTPFLRAAAMGDLTNPLANKAEVLRFINADVNVYLSRLPRGEWLGLEVLGHESDTGICIGSCAIYDTEGRIGWSTVAGLATAGSPVI